MVSRSVAPIVLSVGAAVIVLVLQTCTKGSFIEAEGKEKGRMVPSQPDNLAERLAPVLAMDPAESQTDMGQTVGEGLTLPTADVIARESMPGEKVAPLHAGAVEWLRTIVRPEWLPNDFPTRLFAVRRAVNGEDAFVGAWTTEGRLLQVAVTRQRVHVLTKITPSREHEDDERKVESTLALASALLRLSDVPDVEEWVVRRFGGLVLGYREPGFAREWHETLLFLTDGAGVKFSALKYEDRLSPRERGSGIRQPIPWFPPDEEESQEE